MALTDEAKAERARYLREWRHANPEKVRAARERYWERRAAKAKAEREANVDA